MGFNSLLVLVKTNHLPFEKSMSSKKILLYTFPSSSFGSHFLGKRVSI
jgi:hypothetical protein